MMKLLLDTHLLLWAASDPKKLSSAAQNYMQKSENELFFSAGSLWEVAIKCGLGRDDFQVDVHLLRRGLLDNGYQELAITSAHTVFITHLPPIHKDPFDRLFVAQSTIEGMVLLTSDAVVAQYSDSVRLV